MEQRSIFCSLADARTNCLVIWGGTIGALSYPSGECSRKLEIARRLQERLIGALVPLVVWHTQCSPIFAAYAKGQDSIIVWVVVCCISFSLQANDSTFCVCALSLYYYISISDVPSAVQQYTFEIITLSPRWDRLVGMTLEGTVIQVGSRISVRRPDKALTAVKSTTTFLSHLPLWDCGLLSSWVLHLLLLPSPARHVHILTISRGSPVTRSMGWSLCNKISMLHFTPRLFGLAPMRFSSSSV